MSSFLYSILPVINQSDPQSDDALGCDLPPGAKRRELQIAGWTLVWSITFVGAAQLLSTDRLSGFVAWVVAIIPTILGAFLLVAYTRHLRQTDELQRLVQLQAMGWAFGGGVLAIFGYSLFARLGAPELDATVFGAIMTVLFAIAVLIGGWRYR